MSMKQNVSLFPHINLDKMQWKSKNCKYVREITVFSLQILCTDLELGFNIT